MAFAPGLARARVVDADGALDGGDLRRGADALVAALAAAGLREGGCVALALHPARALVPSVVAAWEIGATIVLVPPALGAAELAAVAQGLGPALVLTTADEGARIANATGGTVNALGVDMLSPLINVGGLKVSPQEVSEALERHPAVRQAAVVGVPDARGEQRVTAAVVLARAVPDSELIAHCSGELAEHKVPRRIVVLEALPVGPTGKVRLLAEDLAEKMP